MIIAFTGAGVSKESGIDTFQDRPGIRNYLTREFAQENPEKFREVMREFVYTVSDKEPNDAHKALAEYGVPIITMNVDMLHENAGSEYVLKVHGRLPCEEELAHCEKLRGVPVLYGDAAPNYNKAFNWVDFLGPEDVLLVIGASEYTLFSSQIRQAAYFNGVEVYEIQDNASIKVRKYLENNIDKLVNMDKLRYNIEKISGKNI
jgi:NAD-dependent deacetylase